MATETWSIPTTPTRDKRAVLAELRGASNRFGTGAAAVDAFRDVDLTVRSGELLAVLGPNGAGKTTAISMLTGLTRPTAGTATLFGRDPRDLDARRRIGAMLQASGVPETLRVGELLAEFRGYYPSPLSLAQIVEASLEGDHDDHGTSQRGRLPPMLQARGVDGIPHRRDVCGHLAPGMLGDVTILSGDIAGATPAEIRALQVIATIVGGNIAY